MQGRKKERRSIWRQYGSQSLGRTLPQAAFSIEKLIFSRISTANAKKPYSLEHLKEYNKCPIYKAGRYTVNLAEFSVK